MWGSTQARSKSFGDVAPFQRTFCGEPACRRTAGAIQSHCAVGQTGSILGAMPGWLHFWGRGGCGCGLTTPSCLLPAAHLMVELHAAWMLVASCREPSAQRAVPLCHVMPRGASGSEGPCESPAVLWHTREPHRCGYGAAHSGCVTCSLCLVPIHLRAALLRPCSTAAICTCGWRWQGKSHPLSACPLIHPADKRLPACLADSTGRAAAPCQGPLKSSPRIDWPCHRLRDVFL